MQSFSTHTPSPSKRTNFRSKTKLREVPSTLDSKLKTMPSFYVYLKDFPLDTGEDVLSIVRCLQPTHNSFLENLENLKLYKPQLAGLFEDNWADFMGTLKSVVVKLMRRSDRLLEQKDKKIAYLLEMNRELENREQQWKEKIDKIEHLRQLENAQLNMADAELQIVGSQMRQIYKLLQGDMAKVTNYLTKLETDRVALNEEGSNHIFSSLKTLSVLMGNMEAQQRSTGASLTNMRELIKAMTKCSKVSTGTQVDESELLTQAGAIFSDVQQQVPFDIADANSVNVNTAKGGHLIDQLKVKERQFPAQSFKVEKHGDKPWNLTPTLLAFLQNMSKNNQNGKVLPWEYTKQLIGQIYQERNIFEADMAAGGIGNSMQFDEFVVFYFLNKHRIRRLAQVKLLQLIISLKYYSRYWTRAEMFCQLMDVMRYHPLFDNIDGFNYKIDFNTQNFFFAIYKKLVTYSSVEEEGATYIPVKQVKKLMRVSLYFTEEVNRSRLLAKLDKGLRVFDNSEYCDFDYALSLFLDEYLATKKRICSSLTRSFSRKFDENQGYFSIDEMKDLFTDQLHLYRAGDEMQYKFPIKSDLQVAKLYLYTATAGKNGYDFNVNNFIASVQRYGFDAPFPFLHSCPKSKKHKDEPHQGTTQQVTSIIKNEQQRVKTPEVEPESIDKVEIKDGINLSKERVNVGVKIFSQHFSLLRELYSYVDIFAKTLKEQKNPEVLWKSFDQIKILLQRGCDFMRYPLIKEGQK